MYDDMFQFLENPLSVSPKCFDEKSNHPYYLGIMKMAFLGSKGVGITRLFCNLVNEPYQKNSHQLQYKICNLHFGEQKITAQIWGKRHLPSGSMEYYYLGKDTKLFVLCFDLSNHNSFVELNSWLRTIDWLNYSEAPILLIGTKRDLERQVPYEEAKDFATANSNDKRIIHYIETSVEGDINISKILEAMVYCIVEDFILKHPEESLAATPPRNGNPRGFWQRIRDAIPCCGYPQPEEPDNHYPSGPKNG